MAAATMDPQKVTGVSSLWEQAAQKELPKQPTSMQQIREKLKAINEQAQANLIKTNNTLAKLDVVKIDTEKRLEHLGKDIRSEIEASREVLRRDDEKLEHKLDRVNLVQSLEQHHAQDSERNHCCIITILLLIIVVFIALALLF